MSNLDNIIDEILQDAENESKKIVEDARKEVADLVGKTESEAQKKADKIVEKAKVEGTQSKDRIISNSSLTARDMVLVAKQEMINKVFDLTKEKLKTLNHEVYLSFVEKSLKTLEIKEDSEIILTESEKKLDFAAGPCVSPRIGLFHAEPDRSATEPKPRHHAES